MINRPPDATIFSTRPGRSQTNCIPFRGKGRERKPAATEKPTPIRRPPARAGLQIISPRKNQPGTPSDCDSQKQSAGVRSISFILYNRPSPVRLGMVLHPFIPPLFHHRIMSWKSQWTGIRSKSRRSRERNQRVECLLESRRRLRQIPQEICPGRQFTGGIRSRPFHYRRLTSRQPAPALTGGNPPPAAGLYLATAAPAAKQQ